MRKPLIERKRRERINNCLDQLKETVIGAFRLDVSIQPRVSPQHVNRLTSFKSETAFQQQSKLEKADILEMTVKHLQNIHSNRRSGKDSGTCGIFGYHCKIARYFKMSLKHILHYTEYKTQT